MPGVLHDLRPLKELASSYDFSAIIVFPICMLHDGTAERLRNTNPHMLASSLSTAKTEEFLQKGELLSEPVLHRFKQNFVNFGPNQKWVILDGDNPIQKNLNETLPKKIARSFIATSITGGASWDYCVALFSQESQTDLYARFGPPEKLTNLISLNASIYDTVQDLRKLYAYRLNPYTAYGKVSVRECQCVSRIAQCVPDDVVCEELSIKSTRYLVDTFKIKLMLPTKSDAIRFALREGLAP